jgi:hypothetical protein
MFFFLKNYDSKCCWKNYCDFGGGKKNNLIQSFLYNIMPNITYISCSVWLFCNTIAIHLLKKKTSCDHISLNTYKSLLGTDHLTWREYLLGKNAWKVDDQRLMFVLKIWVYRHDLNKYLSCDENIINLMWSYILEYIQEPVRDRPFNLKGRLWFFVLFRIFFSDNTRVRIFIFLSRKVQICFP